MGSLIMHIAASKIIADKYNLSDRFMAGSIMPDIYGKCGIDRNVTHYINPSISNLPNYNEYVNEQKEGIKDEIQFGYLAHLVEDYIWFSRFIDKYAKVVSKNPERIMYLGDNSIHSSEEYVKDIYDDYACIDHYICQKHSLDIENIRTSISKYYDIPGSKEKLGEYLYLHEYDINRKNEFLSQKDIDEFIELASKEAENVLEKYLEI